jgi:hypothetical protein
MPLLFVVLPELVALALPPPFVSDSKPLAVPELVVVALALAFWPACGVVFVKGAAAVPELVQVRSVAAVVHANCAEAGEAANSAASATIAAPKAAAVTLSTRNKLLE